MKNKLKKFIFNLFIFALAFIERIGKVCGYINCCAPTLFPFLENEYSYNRERFVLVQWKKKLMSDGSVCLPNIQCLGRRYVARILALNPSLRRKGKEIVFISKSHDLTTTVPVAIAVRRGAANKVDMKTLGKRLERLRGEGSDKGIESYRLLIPANRSEHRRTVRAPKESQKTQVGKKGNVCTDVLGVICGAAVVDTAVILGLTGASGSEGVSLIGQIIVGIVSMCMMICWTYVRKRTAQTKHKRRK